MVRANCPYCVLNPGMSEIQFHIVRVGRFRRKSDAKSIQRYFCRRCLKHFSSATTHPCYRQKKRQVNFRVYQELASCVSLRRIARNLKLSRATVNRKLIFLGIICLNKLQEDNLKAEPCTRVQFDDLETFEHTKLKPLSVTLAVEYKTRRILGFEVAQMAAKGHLSQLSVKKYGVRKDERTKARHKFFEKLKPLVKAEALFESDENPYYPKDLKIYFPKAKHNAFKGQRGSTSGQGELKKVRFDPLFSLNHTCAMLRANVNRLVRKTWCTTKLSQNLAHHLAIYAHFHNSQLIESS